MTHNNDGTREILYSFTQPPPPPPVICVCVLAAQHVHHGGWARWMRIVRVLQSGRRDAAGAIRWQPETKQGHQITICIHYESQRSENALGHIVRERERWEITWEIKIKPPAKHSRHTHTHGAALINANLVAQIIEKKTEGLHRRWDSKVSNKNKRGLGNKANACV
jgi:hypothetical protein